MSRTFALSVCLAAGMAAMLPAATPERALAEAQQEMARIQQLVDAGVAPRKQLEEAEANFQEARDEATLASTLYAQIELSEFTPELSQSMKEAANRKFTRRQTALKEAQLLADQGVIARTALTPLLEDLDRARRTRDDAEMRAQLFEELASMARTEAEVAVVDPYDQLLHQDLLPAAIRYDGKGIFTDAHWRKVVLAFEKEFHHGMTISAKGDTLYHRSLGFDHRGRVDIALNPDSEEGVWLRQYLEKEQIPYFAYRRAVTGQASAAHIHLGPPSPHWQS